MPVRIVNTHEAKSHLSELRALGKLDFPDGLADALVAGGYLQLTIGAVHGEAAANCHRTIAARIAS